MTATTENVLLIDGDIFAYKAAFGNEKEYDLGDGVVTLQADTAEIATRVVELVEAVQDKIPGRVIVALSSGTNFRKALYPAYKGNRGRKPLGLRHAKDQLAAKFETKVKEGIEADDVLGILSTHPTLIKGKRIIVSIDKDLLQIPGRHFNPDKDEKRMVSTEEGDRAFYIQCLTGDATDNYPGIKGVGPVKAAAILDDTNIDETEHPDLWQWHRILDAYGDAGHDADFALTQARLARILRHTDYDFKLKEPILWTPK